MSGLIEWSGTNHETTFFGGCVRILFDSLPCHAPSAFSSQSEYSYLSVRTLHDEYAWCSLMSLTVLASFHHFNPPLRPPLGLRCAIIWRPDFNSEEEDCL